MGYNYIKSTRRFRKKTGKFVKKVAPYASMAAQALMTANRVASLINVEKKYIDTLSNGTTLVASPNGTVVLLNGCAQGDTQSTRDGISIKSLYVYVEGFFVLNATTQDILRVGIVLDKQPNGSAMAFGSLFNSASTGPIARTNLDNNRRFRIMCEKEVTLSTAGKAIVKFRMYRKLKVHTSYYVGSNTGTITDISTNAVYLYFAGNLAATMSTINYAVRYRFVDN